MKIKTLNKSSIIEPSKRLNARYKRLENLLSELRTIDLFPEVVDAINEKIDLLNKASASSKDFSKQLRKTQYAILKLIETEQKMVPKNHYRNKWMAIGMSVFGVPFGVALGTALGNMAFMSIGFPIGMAIGIAIGTEMDNKATEEGRQLDIEFEF